MDFERIRSHEPTAVTDQPQEAAVIVPVITPETEPRILFTKRADHLSDHPGQMSFPGGGHEELDGSLEATARREGHEEIGLEPSEAEFIGRLDDIRTVTRYSVRPFVAEIPDREYEPRDGEVAEISVLPVAELTDLDNYHSERRDHPHYGEIRLHYFYVGGVTVWGATARILVQFLELATAWQMPPEVDREAEPDAEFPV